MLGLVFRPPPLLDLVPKLYARVKNCSLPDSPRLAHPVHCTPLDASAPHWRTSRLVAPPSFVPALLCGLFGEQHQLVALGTHEELVSNYEYSPRHGTLLIDYRGTARVLRFRSVCRGVHYVQECLVEVRPEAKTEAKTLLFRLVSATMDTVLLLLYAGGFLLAVWYTLCR